MLWHWFCPIESYQPFCFFIIVYIRWQIISLFICLFFCLLVLLFCLVLCLFAFLLLCLSFCLLGCPFVFMSVLSSVCLSVILSIFPSICPFVCPSVRLFVCPSKLYLCQIVKNWHQTHQVNISNIHVLNVTQNFKLNPIWRLIKWINMSM